MQCHYEVLGIPRDADDAAIKKSYRKLALKNHPDKNLEDIEACTKRFHLIQQAYEVLADPQERAWYDKHREAILKGGLGHGGDYKDDCLDVYKYFNTSCFSGYNDGEKGFYTVYNEVFNKLAAEDSEYKEDSDEEIPTFGTSESAYEDVVGPFYGYWEGYCTLRSYVWVEKFDTREAPNRQVRRAMEQENKKIRDKAKRERNEEVRALVAFVKKRDKRVQAYKKKLEERAVEVARLAKERKEESRRQRLKSLEGYKEADWSAATALEEDLENLEAGYADEFGEDESYSESDGEGEEAEEAGEGEEELYLDIPYCIACNKAFKTEKALSNHENSKKHRERVAALKSELLEDDAALAAQLDDVEEDLSDLDLSGDDDDDTSQKLSKKQKKKKRQQRAEMNGESLPAGEEENDAKSDDAVFECVPCEKTFNSGDALNAHNKTKKHKRTLASYEDLNKKSEGMNASEKKSSTAEQSTQESQKNEDTEDVKANPETAGKAEGGAEGDSGTAPPVTQPSNKKKPSTNRGAGEAIPCNKCKQVFPSRNKLFEHVKKTGHALRLDGDPVPHEEAGPKGKKKKKGKK